MANLNIYGYVAKPELLAMLSLHLLGDYDDCDQKNTEALKEIGVIDRYGMVIELSDHFQEQVDRGYFSDDYFEFETFSVSDETALRDIIINKPWVFGFSIEAED